MEDVEKTEVELENDTEVEQENQQPEEEVDSTDWKAEALKHRAIAERLKKKISTQNIIKPKQEHDDELVKTVNRLNSLEEKRQFGFENNLSPQETDYAFKFSGGKPTKETLEDPFFKGALDSYRAKQRLENNTPSSTSRSPVFGDKPFSELSDEERAKAFEARVKGIKK